MKVPLNHKIHVGWEQCLAADDPICLNEMYGCASEIVTLIKAALMEITGKMITSVRTLESGVVEEHAVVIWVQGEKSLLFRMWPIFFSDDKRVEYSIMTDQKSIRELILTHVSMFAKTNDARLVEK